MPIFFKPSASDFSLSADSIGNRWLQEPVVRPNGFPLYHWIQTERSEGLLTLEGQELLLKPGDGVLMLRMCRMNTAKTTAAGCGLHPF